jgi:hypothetical protein
MLPPVMGSELLKDITSYFPTINKTKNSMALSPQENYTD